MPTSQGCCRIKGMIAIGHSQPPGTKALSNCKMFGSASPACGKRAPTDLKESIIHRQGEAHWVSRAYYLHYHCPKVQRTERATKKLKNHGHTKTRQRLTNGPWKKIWKNEHLSLKIICEDYTPETKKLSMYSLVNWQNAALVCFSQWNVPCPHTPLPYIIQSKCLMAVQWPL